MRAVNGSQGWADLKRIFGPFRDEGLKSNNQRIITMVIVDTSLWVTHLREGNHHLEELLVDGEVLCHPFIVGELACGNIKNRTEVLTLLHSLVMAPTVTLDELLYFIERNTLMDKGIGFVDAHLLASAQLAEALLWTSDKRLKSAAIDLKLAYKTRDVMF